MQSLRRPGWHSTVSTLAPLALRPAVSNGLLIDQRLAGIAYVRLSPLALRPAVSSGLPFDQRLGRHSTMCLSPLALRPAVSGSLPKFAASSVSTSLSGRFTLPPFALMTLAMSGGFCFCHTHYPMADLPSLPSLIVSSFIYVICHAAFLSGCRT